MLEAIRRNRSQPAPQPVPKPDEPTPANCRAVKDAPAFASAHAKLGQLGRELSEKEARYEAATRRPPLPSLDVAAKAMLGGESLDDGPTPEELARLSRDIDVTRRALTMQRVECDRLARRVGTELGAREQPEYDKRVARLVKKLCEVADEAAGLEEVRADAEARGLEIRQVYHLEKFRRDRWENATLVMRTLADIAERFGIVPSDSK